MGWTTANTEGGRKRRDGDAEWLRAMGISLCYGNGFVVTLHDAPLELPKRWGQPRLTFVTSRSDLFHEQAPLEFIRRALTGAHMTKCPGLRHLPKRAWKLALHSLRPGLRRSSPIFSHPDWTTGEILLC